MHLGDGTIITFKQCSRGIYYYDMNNTEQNIINSQVNDYTFLNTVESNKTYFYQIEIKGEGKATIPPKIVGWSSTQTLKEAVEKIKS